MYNLFLPQFTSFITSVLLERSWMTYGLFSMGMLTYYSRGVFFSSWDVFRYDVPYTIHLQLHKYVRFIFRKAPVWNPENNARTVIEHDAQFMSYRIQIHVAVLIMSFIGSAVGRRLSERYRHTNHRNEIVKMDDARKGKNCFCSIQLMVLGLWIYSNGVSRINSTGIFLCTLATIMLPVSPYIFLRRRKSLVFIPVMIMALGWGLWSFKEEVKAGSIQLSKEYVEILSQFYGVPGLFIAIAVPCCVFSYVLCHYLFDVMPPVTKNKVE